MRARLSTVSIIWAIFQIIFYHNKLVYTAFFLVYGSFGSYAVVIYIRLKPKNYAF